VVRWLKSEGDAVQVGEAVVELETDKVSYELESPIAGVLVKIVAGENVQVPVGGALCHIEEERDTVRGESRATEME
jgi:pyruvate/2-oxoglutarate dehydrogenase complex dihydrolipoamide acyltransferase (E2) component